MLQANIPGTDFARSQRKLPHLILALSVCALSAFADQKAHASSWIERLDVSFDTTQDSVAGPVRDHESLTRVWRQPPAVRTFGLPENAELSALAIAGSSFYWVPDITVSVASLAIRPRDVAVTVGGNTTIFVSGATLGLPESAKVDAVAFLGSELYFSLDTSATVGALQVTRNDILKWNGATVSIHQSGASLGIPPSTNLVALDLLSPAALLATFSSGFDIASLTVSASDIVQINIGTNITWSVTRAGDRLGTPCAPCRINSISASGVLDRIYPSGFESNEFY
jgi:hypothetical protein